ncbi:uncharacterized protein IL334_004918 [Kwoniella shivajii]|uniref:CID domain-containing protein n=1 Tax=Kwoniella shivajii TaxID=564305 RepID=A0ABZ1D1P9_9TREE|nr:hypothetical protein IL334_004918 [Kwoniella shivajii]
MADLKEFDKLLSVTVTAPRLSGSKVQKLASLSSELVAEDHHIVTTFFKLNASLPPASQSRISSLYVFDAMARGARSEVNKGIGAQVRKERGKGTQAGLLLKLEGVVDSWIEGMLEDGKGGVWTEGKEKTKKIVDIWSKASTFPKHCLDRLSSKIVNAAPQAGPSTTPVPLDNIGRSESDRSVTKGQGSTTPPYPPAPPSTGVASTIQPGGLPPELAKLLGIAQPANSTPNTNSPIHGNPTSNTGSTPGPVIPNLDLAAILASVNKAQPMSQQILSPNQSQPSFQQPQPQPQQQQQPINIPNLANLASLLPPNIFSPSNQPQPQPQPQAQLHNQSPASIHNFGQAGPSNNILNSAQNAALAKFASLAQAGAPPLPLTTPPPSGLPMRSPQNGYTNFPMAENPHTPRNDFGLPRRSPQKGFTNLPTAVPEGMRAEPMRGPPPRERSHVRRESQDSNWDRRGSHDNDIRGRGGMSGRGSGRPRSRSPDRDRDQRFDRPTDNGWGGRRNDSNSSSNPNRGRGGFTGSNFNDHNKFQPNHTNHTQNYNQNQNQKQDQNQQFHRNDNFSTGLPSNVNLPPNPSLPPHMGLPTNRSLTNNGGLPPRPTIQPSSHGPSGRAPPPAWMEERSVPASDLIQASNGKQEIEAGEEDMALDESDDEQRPDFIKPTIQHHPSTGDLRNDHTQNYHSQQQQQQQQQEPQQQQQQQHQQQGRALASGQGLTLDSFPITTFDPSSPDSWVQLAEAWKNSMGRDPNQMELMAFLAGGMMGGNGKEENGMSAGQMGGY